MIQSLFRRESKRKDYRLVGSFLPPRVHNYLTLYSLARNTTKAKIIKQLVEGWLIEEKINYPESKLVEEITQHLNMRWKIIRLQGTTFSTYKDLVKQELTDKGIRDVIILIILNELRQ